MDQMNVGLLMFVVPLLSKEHESDGSCQNQQKAETALQRPCSVGHLQFKQSALVLCACYEGTGGCRMMLLPMLICTQCTVHTASCMPTCTLYTDERPVF